MRTILLARTFWLGAWLIAIATGCQRESGPTVMVYGVQEQGYTKKILKEFSRRTGIRVQSVIENNPAAAAALVQRLINEADRPACDVVWADDELRMRLLASQQVFRETNGWVAFGFQSRRLVVNTNKLPAAARPTSLRELTNQQWRGKIALANPLLGTTATELLALRQLWGDSEWQRWCRALKSNQPIVVEDDAEVVQRVGRGEAWIGLTEFQAIAAGQKKRWPIAALPMTEESLLLPQLAGVIRNAPHPAEAQALFEFLQSNWVQEQLLAEQVLEGMRPGLRPHLNLNWKAAVDDFTPVTASLKEIFSR